MANFEDQPANFTDDNGNKYLVRCPQCKRENWVGTITKGICAWCEWKIPEKRISEIRFS